MEDGAPPNIFYCLIHFNCFTFIYLTFFFIKSIQNLNKNTTKRKIIKSII
ncbi:hypothetical protein HanIR_Chr08g0376431 [Helianthus annuus]|nr:hypothetical protein HanIR_Chr08g0376431 [Helianthus annuus]